MERSDDFNMIASKEGENTIAVKKAKLFLPLLSYNISLMCFKVVKIFFQI
jgi:hypothetical protein